MPFYMNPFDVEFRGAWLLSDRQYVPNFIVPANKNKSDQMVAWNLGPYDMSSTNTLTINYAIDPTLKAFASVSVNVAGSTPSSTLASEVVFALNQSTAFSSIFQAVLKTWVDKNRQTQSIVQIQSKRPNHSIRAYVSNSGAETKLGFNKKAGIAEIPSYYDKHLISNSYDPESEGMLIKLDGTDTSVDRPIIRNFLNDSSWTNSNLKADYELLNGRSGMFMFKKQTVDGSDRITQIIEYHAGAVAGDLARKTTYTYTSANKTPDKITEVPYVLTSGDLITP